jgi:hypothetical protein
VPGSTGRTRRRFEVRPGGYRGTRYAIEPDASAASYFLAAAAITGGRVRVTGLTADAQQGDAAFADVLAAMGAEVVRDDEGIEVRGTGHLEGIDVDLGDVSDTAQTLAAVAVFASGPTRVRGIGFIRRKETDRIGAVVTELRRLGIRAHEEPDGFLIEPGQTPPRPGPDLRRPPHGDELRAARPDGPGHRDRRSRLRRQDLPDLLRRARPAAHAPRVTDGRGGWPPAGPSGTAGAGRRVAARR